MIPTPLQELFTKFWLGLQDEEAEALAGKTKGGVLTTIVTPMEGNIG